MLRIPGTTYSELQTRRFICSHATLQLQTSSTVELWRGLYEGRGSLEDAGHLKSCTGSEVPFTGRGRHPCQPVVVRDPSLLEKLLATDIRAEHSRLLQCMRFLVANNFLQDVGSKPLLYPPEPPTALGQPPGESLLAQGKI